MQRAIVTSGKAGGSNSSRKKLDIRAVVTGFELLGGYRSRLAFK
jgi:hypothetical protein